MFIKIALSKSLLFSLSFKVWSVNLMSKNSLSEECLKLEELTTVVFMQPSNGFQDTSLTPFFLQCILLILLLAYSIQKFKMNVSKWEKDKTWSLVLMHISRGSFDIFSCQFFCIKINLLSCAEFERCIWENFIFFSLLQISLKSITWAKCKLLVLGQVCQK